MKPIAVFSRAALVLALIAGASAAEAQGTFKIPYPFQAGGAKLPAGDYTIGPKGADQVALRREPGGTDVLVPVLKRIPPPAQGAPAEPQAVFHAVGNFEPSYTEYMTDYILAELWLPGQDGFLIHVTKGAHSLQTVKGQKAGK